VLASAGHFAFAAMRLAGRLSGTGCTCGWADARAFDQPTLEKNPAVNAVCSVRVLLASRRGRALRIPLSAWRVDVLPPSEAAFYSGARTYRCVANVLGRQPRTSLFRR